MHRVHKSRLHVYYSMNLCNSTHIFMGKFSSEEIESQYNLIKMLLAEPEKYRDAINAIKKDIAYMPIELKKKLAEENIIL